MARLYEQCFKKAAQLVGKNGQSLTGKELDEIGGAFEARVVAGRRQGMTLAEALDAAKRAAPARRTAMQQQYIAARKILAISELHRLVEAGRGVHASAAETLGRAAFTNYDDKTGTLAVEGLKRGEMALNQKSIDMAKDATGSQWLGLKEFTDRNVLLGHAMEGIKTGSAKIEDRKSVV